MLVREGQAIVAATPDEPDPAHTRYSPDVALHWHYRGSSRQLNTGTRLLGTTWWCASTAARPTGPPTQPIPGGVAYENFELEAPFEPGQEFCFGIIPGTPATLGFSVGPK